ncbi:tyrosine-type recombinase/integrase [Candidatus Nitrososphaera gargensis]|uniref:tyrosine-type recombinase/integrase n=1 Tax=Candidatus Nitrososphaera gargensis TaxID=497727 RepID=UPI0011E54F56|nr:site-specific integrase [Candidatus Nitrososphaera gargensis]
MEDRTKKGGPGGFRHQKVSGPPALNVKKAAYCVGRAEKGDSIDGKTGRKKKGRGKYRKLLQHEDVRRWYDNLCRGSKVTADVYLRRLGLISETTGITLQEIVKKAAQDERWAYNFLLDFVTRMEGQNHAGSYIASGVKAVKSWLSHNGIELKRKIKIRGVGDAPTLKDKGTLAQDRLRTLFLNSPPEARCVESLIAQSGLRPEVIGNYDGSDGLRVGDILEIKVRNGDGNGNSNTIAFDRIPCMLVVRKELSKAGHQYFTFMTSETCEYLREYLYRRIKSGEVLVPDSPLIVPEKSRRPFLTAASVGKIARTYMRKVGINLRPYDLRHTFATQLMLAESRGMILRDYRTFFMGHKGDIENRYTTNKHSLPETVIDDMRKAFARSASFLQSNSSLNSDGVLNLRDESYKRMLLLAGYTEEEIDKENILRLSDEEIAKRAREKLLQSVSNAAAVQNNEQKVIPLDELPDYLSKGWKCDHIIESRQQVIVSCAGHTQTDHQLTISG